LAIIRPHFTREASNKGGFLDGGEKYLIRQTERMKAQVAELVDALGSGPSGGNTVGVRVPSWAPKIKQAANAAFFIFKTRFGAFFLLCPGTNVLRHSRKKQAPGSKKSAGNKKKQASIK
jgi:hypothetical protein